MRKEWNKVAKMKHIWNLLQDKNISLWSDWVKENRLKKKNLWEAKLNKNSSWIWRKILKLQNEARSKIKKSIGDSKNNLLWHDNWHLHGPLLEKYGNRIVYDSRLNMEAKVKEIIKNGTWSWPSTNSIHLLEIKAFMPL